MAQLVTGIVIIIGLALGVVHVVTGGSLTGLFRWLDTWGIWIIIGTIGTLGAIGRILIALDKK